MTEERELVVCSSCGKEFEKKDTLMVVTETINRLFCITCLKNAHKFLQIKSNRTLDELELLIGIKRFLRKKGILHDKVN